MRKIALTRDEAFELLDLPWNSSTEEIKSRWKEIQLTEHPDLFSPERKELATKRFSWLSLAYQILKGNQNPGRPEKSEWIKYFPSSRQPQGDDWSELGIKRLVLDLAKRLGVKPVKRIGIKHPELEFALPLSEWIAIDLLFDPKERESMVGFCNWNEKTIWKPVPKTWITTSKFEEIRAEVILKKLIFEKHVSFWETKAGKPVDTQSGLLQKIKDNPFWEKSLLLRNVVTSLEKFNRLPSSLGNNSVYFIDTALRLVSLYKKVSPQSRTSTLENFIQTCLTRLNKGNTLTPTQENNLEKFERIERFDQKRKSPSAPKGDSGGPDFVKVDLHLIDRLNRRMVFLEPKDRQRIDLIMMKQNPIRAAKMVAAKIKDGKKALRRAKAALEHSTMKSTPTEMKVAMIFINRAIELGVTI